jgi:hypothetical protein
MFEIDLLIFYQHISMKRDGASRKVERKTFMITDNFCDMRGEDFFLIYTPFF